jgi:16S rRNA (guanine966-N2)-methyltransferase
MRIIAGEHRGRKLLPPPGDATRPITDRVKQSLFDILTPLLPDACVYDCFSGTGSMGLECLSRGAAHATFFDADKGALANLKKNIAALQVEPRTTVIAGDLFRHLTQSAVRTPQSPITLLFLDPPYRFLREQPAKLVSLAESLATRHLAPDATVVFRHDAADQLSLPALKVYDTRTYGGMTLELLVPHPVSA